MLAIYCRISGKKAEGKDTSIDIQKLEGEKLAAKLGLKFRVYIDKGISGTKENVSDRPAFAEMLYDMSKNIVTHVYALNQARLERNPDIWSIFKFQVILNEIKYYPDGVLTDLADPIIDMVTSIVSITNKMFVNMTRISVNKTFDKRANDGMTHGLILYGYKKSVEGKYEIYEDEAKIVRRIFDASLNGKGTYTIAKELNDDKIPTKIKTISKKKIIKRKDSYTGKETTFNVKDIEWRGGVVHKILKNSAYKGMKLWNKYPKEVNGKPVKKELINVPIPAMFSEEYFDKVNNNLSVNKSQKTGKRPAFNYLLNGLVTCGCCNQEYRGKKRILPKQSSAYKCKQLSKCPDSRGLSLVKLENFIINHLFINKKLQELLANLPMSNDNSLTLKTQLKKYEDDLIKKTKLKEKYLKWQNDDRLKNDSEVIELYIKAKKDVDKLKENIEILTKQIFESNTEFVKNRLTNSVNEYQINASFEDTKRLVHSLIENITIKYTKQGKTGFHLLDIKYKGFDESSIFITNCTALKWDWLRYYRNGALTPEQLAEDIQDLKDLYEFKGIEYSEKDFIGYVGTETSIPMYQSIVLQPEKLIKFD